MTRIEIGLDGGEPIVLDDGALDAHRDALSTLGAAPEVRLAYAAAHVAWTREPAPGTPREALPALVDWDETRAFRRHLAAQGMAIAEAMDTAQRFELGWPTAERLIIETGALDLPHGFVAGAGVDHLERIDDRRALVDGVVHQARVIQEAGGEVILLPLPWLTANGCTEDEFVETYAAIVDELDGPLYVHWLGEMFHPAMRGYFPGDSFARVMAHEPAKVRGAKLSLLDDAFELRVRAELLEREQLVLTGDDFHFAPLIRGSGAHEPPARTTTVGERTVAIGDFSHALLGVLDGVAIPAGLALRALSHGEVEVYERLMAPCEAFGRHVFEAPTSDYKAGLAFLAWLNGHQSRFVLLESVHAHRDRAHLVEVARLAAECGAIEDAALAAERLAAFAAG